MNSAITGTDWLAELGHNGRVYVVPEFRLVYVSVAKNACTTLKWVIAELAREDTAGFRSGLHTFVSEEHAVHARGQFTRALYPDEVDPALRPEVHPDNGWFIFGVVRDPRARLFSAWQEKLLMQNPGYRWLRDEPWYPNIPDNADEIASGFARFVSAAAADPNFPLLEDTHFRLQTKSLSRHIIPYSRIYPIAEFDELRADLMRHLESQGWSGPLHFWRGNETPLRANATVFADRDVRENIEKIYATDFEQFGELWDFSRIAAAPAWESAAIQEVRVRAQLGRRLGDVREIALRHRKRANREAKRAREANARIAALERELATARQPSVQVRSLLGRIRRCVRGAARTVIRRARLMSPGRSGEGPGS